ncbi:ATP-binding SpoIIE family protein phosphatase [Streptomyces coffeae]|uniref:Serine/threonine-protein phosphatase n=1 Tax=Streptomyces coffeae TaxID=621382 RepID=A0ABS1NM81_9ACTN|nr:ATP-binding SpoIIE family protein phosphatase [Streptomyces coffeae]MBL1101161.1 serine/threonine-protein phosphatase [Streptomyces coffeae]
MAHPPPREGPDHPTGRAQGRAALRGRGAQPPAAGPGAPQPPPQRGRGGGDPPPPEAPAEQLRDEAPHGPETQTDRLRYLDTATRQIARGMDLDETLHELCRAAVPAFADVAVVHLRDPLPAGDEESPGPLVLRPHTTGPACAGDPDDPAPCGTPGVITAATGLPPDGPAPTDSTRRTISGSLADLLNGGRPAFCDTPGVAAAAAELLGGDESGPGSVPPGRRLIIAPLRGRRHVLGAAVLLRNADRPAFTGDDLLVASQLATHTALGMNKAVLYGREASVADALQRTMLPSSLPEPMGVRLASRYLPSSKTARIGGDWYDAIPLPGNRVALVIGDVMGHSMTSAAIMGQLRTTVQTLAGLDLTPDEVLHHLDEQAQRLGSQHMATCLYAIYDPIAHRLQVANAGHPPPVLLHPEGRGEVLRVPPGAPIGVGGVGFETVEIYAPTGATLLLYTDGLVESRDTDVWTGVELLRDRLHATAHVLTPPPLELLCDAVVGGVGPSERDDDIALLAARFHGIPSYNVAYWFLEPEAQTPGRARRLTRRTLQRWRLESLLETTELMVSEVVTNAVRYASRPLSLRLLRTDVLRCEVGDDSPFVPRMLHARPGDEGGRGLFLVNQIAQRWGATRLSTGKVVWFEQQLPKGRRMEMPDD